MAAFWAGWESPQAGFRGGLPVGERRDPVAGAAERERSLWFDHRNSL